MRNKKNYNFDFMQICLFSVANTLAIGTGMDNLISNMLTAAGHLKILKSVIHFFLELSMMHGQGLRMIRLERSNSEE